MKKKIIFITLIILIGFFAVSNFFQFRETLNFHRQIAELKESQYTDNELNRNEDVSVYLNDHRTGFKYGKNQKITVNVKNNSKNTAYYIGGDELEIYYKGVWRRLIFMQGRALPALILKPSAEHSIDKIDIDKAPYSAPLKKGHYRLVVQAREENKGRITDKYELSVEFNIQ